MSNCICGNGGGNNGDDGDRCPDCLSSECSGECQEIGGGGTGGGEETLPGGNQDISENNDTSKFIVYKGLLIDSSLIINGLTRTLEILQQLDGDCMASSLISNISGIKFVGYDDLKKDAARFNPNTQEIKVNVQMWQRDLNTIEEMIHALQKKNGNYMGGDTHYTNNLLNMEVEAKIAIYLYLMKTNSTNMMPWGQQIVWDEIIPKYLNSRSEEDYIAIAEYIKSVSAEYSNSEKYRDMPEYRNLNSITPLFNCPDYLILNIFYESNDTSMFRLYPNIIYQ